ncbi:DUF5682 family protein [Treponema primitia]|uniref:DUF5682 family protein n=1 Tax=Treponema primitia TaxID=88058 RepID=UPI0039810027
MAGILREPQSNQIEDNLAAHGHVVPAFNAAELEERYRRAFDFSAPLLYFPVRHHSPACSVHLQKTISRYKPDIILIEGPSDADRLIPHIADAGSAPPFCIYYSYDDKEELISGEQEKYRAYYPFLEYSPEHIAIKTAAILGIPATFIDLPYASLLVNRKEKTGVRYRYNEDTEYEVNSYSAMVARKAGFRTYAEFWEACYEIPGAGMETETFVRAMFYMASFMRMAEDDGIEDGREDITTKDTEEDTDNIEDRRETTEDTEGSTEVTEEEGREEKRENREGEEENEDNIEDRRETTEDTEGSTEVTEENEENAEISGDRLETLLRETCMAEHIAGAMKKYAKVLVVCGAFHVPGLMDILGADTGEGSAASNANGAAASDLRNYDKNNAAVYLMPYTFAEMDGRKGYAAGMPFPAYYQEIWKQFTAGTGGSDTVFDNTALDFIVRTARFLRGKNPVSIPDEVNALSMAKSLASLRGKKAPGVYDLIDGVQSAFVKGDINQTVTTELDYLLRILSGLGAGKVASATVALVPPLVQNFRELCREFRIRTDTILHQEVTLDILKKSGHYRKSQFFHQMSFLETGFCKRSSGPDYVTGASKNLVREIWTFRFGPQVETALIDQSVYGATIAEACGTIAARQFRDSMTAAEAGKLLIAAEVMGLDSFYDTWRDEIDEVLDREGNFISAVSCLGSLRYLKNLEIMLRSEADAFLLPLIARCYRRGVELMEAGRNSGGDEEQKTCESLRSLYALTVEEPALCNPRLLADQVEAILNEGFCNSRFYGALLAILEKQGRIDMAEFARRINARLVSSADSPDEAASFIGGVFLLGRDALFAGQAILEEIDRVIARMDDDEFLALLPNFRQAFTSFLPTETDRLGRMVAKLYGASANDVIRAEIVSREELSLGMQLDKLAAAAMDKWGMLT